MVPQARDFLAPVDPVAAHRPKEGRWVADGEDSPLLSQVALNIPDYPTVITHPMDLGTVEQRLDRKDDTRAGEGTGPRHVRDRSETCPTGNPVCG